jgi:hypothetical protein
LYNGAVKNLYPLHSVNITAQGRWAGLNMQNEWRKSEVFHKIWVEYSQEYDAIWEITDGGK